MTPTRGRLAVRVYGFAVMTLAVVIALMIGLAKLIRDPHMSTHEGTMEAWAQQLDELHPGREALIAAVPDAAAKLVGALALRDGDGALLWSRGTPPSPGEDDTIVVRFAGHPDLTLTFAPERRPPFGMLAVILGLVLAVIVVPAIWFARSISRPLGQLQAAAEAFGRGDTSARARVAGCGELGAVGGAFDEMADRVEQTLRSQRELLADISHELNTPLARIRVALELATDDPAAAREMLTEVGADLVEIEQIVDDLFTVVRLELREGERAPAARPVVLAELLQRAGDRFASLHPGRSLRLPPPAEPVVVLGDGVLLRRALDNLLDNAAKYSPGDAAIRVETRSEDGRVVVDVVDRGVGMSDDELARAFTPFWRADGSRDRGTGGVGLGLALARRVARAHGGDVHLRSAPGEGTTASLSMPVAYGTNAALVAG